jgi:hypothetical protein
MPEKVRQMSARYDAWLKELKPWNEGWAKKKKKPRRK